MQGLEIYTFVLCLIVFILFSATFTFFIVALIKMNLSLILLGHEDENIKKERLAPPKRSKLSVIETAVSLIMCILLVLLFIFSVYVNLQDGKYFEKIPTVNVVASGSMDKKHPVNTYLAENSLDDQFSTFDLVFTYKVPPVEELELYDIVVYETDGILVIHRIVGIEPPNSVHPDEYWFTCKGDAMERIDRFPVKYEQMRGIYRGERIPFVGSIVSFLQSPAGILSILLVVFGIIGTTVAEKKLSAARQARYEIILSLEHPEDAEGNEEPEAAEEAEEGETTETTEEHKDA